MHKRETRRYMEEQITRRIAELEQAERDAVTQIQLIRTVLAELRALVEPAPVVSGNAVGAPIAPDVGE